MSNRKRKGDEFKITSNSSVYKKLHKFFHAKCDYCPWNRGCNNTSYKKNPSWKRIRRTQYKTIDKTF